MNKAKNFGYLLLSKHDYQTEEERLLAWYPSLILVKEVYRKLSPKRMYKIIKCKE